MDKSLTATSKSTVALSAIIARPPGELHPWPNNPRRHNDRQISQLQASIRQFGFYAPVCTDENSLILKGHGCWKAAVALKLPEIPTLVVSGLSESQKRALVIADNRLGEQSAWDERKLRSEIELLVATDFNIELTGFTTAQIDLLLDPDAAQTSTSAPDPDDLEPEDLRALRVTRPGDLWQLGDHRILCGNSLEADAYSAVMAGEPAQLVITDPPYNVPIDGHVCGSGKVKHPEFAMASGEMSAQQFTEFLRQFMERCAAVMADGALMFSFMDWRHSSQLVAAAEPVFGQLRQLCVWVKDNAGMGTFYRQQHELVHVFKHGKAPHINNFELGQHGRYRTNVWNYAGVNTFSGKGYALLALHPTVKPLALVADALRDCSHRGGVVLDPFAGSGTILLAAQRTGRKARAIELEPRYVDVALKRWMRCTGEQPVLAQSGLTFDDVRGERLLDPVEKQP